MEYAVIATGGKQYLASVGENLVIESLAQAAGESVTFSEVLLTVDNGTVTVGQPKVDGVTVTATVVEQRRGEKLRVFKYRPKSRYSRTMGHRQNETVVRIDAIGGKSTTGAKPAKSKAENTKPAKTVKE
jgi:large subunit ribosomal protein L21